MTPRGAASPTPRCAKQVWNGWSSYPCARSGSVEENGKTWCKQHAPSLVAAKRAARAKAIDAERRASERADAEQRSAKAFADRCVNERAGLIAALRQIEALEKRADGVVGMVDDPHTRALRAACEIARRVLAQSDEPNKEGAKP